MIFESCFAWLLQSTLQVVLTTLAGLSTGAVLQTTGEVQKMLKTIVKASKSLAASSQALGIMGLPVAAFALAANAEARFGL